MNKTLSCLLLLLVTIVTPAKSQDYSHLIPQQYKLETIVIDAGHGGLDNGAAGIRLKEKDVALQLAMGLGSLIKEQFPQINIQYTRTTDEFVSIHERAAKANHSGADLFISLHANAGVKNRLGTQVFVQGMHRTSESKDVAMRENNSILLETNAFIHYAGVDPSAEHIYNAYTFPQKPHISQSVQIANHLVNALRNNGKAATLNYGGFLLFKQTQMPGILIQAGYLTNSSDENQLANANGKSLIVRSVMNAIRAYKADLDAEGARILRTKQEEIQRLEAQRKKREAEEAEARRLAEIERIRKSEAEWAWPSLRSLELTGEQYMVQLLISKSYDETEFPFENIIMSRIDVIDSYKYLIAPVSTKSEAQILHKQAQEKGYRNAYILHYRDGKIVR